MSDCNLHENQRKAGTLCRSMHCTKCPPYRKPVLAEIEPVTKHGRTNEEKRVDFEAAAKPLIKFINNNYDPHTKVIVDCGRAEIVSAVMSMVTEEFYLD